MTGHGSTPILTMVSIERLLTSWSYGYGRVTEVIVGFWLGTTPCSTSRDTWSVGMLRVPISKTARRLRGDCNRKTSPYAKKSPQPRCLKRLLGRLPLYKQCSLSSPWWRHVIPRCSYPQRRPHP